MLGKRLRSTVDRILDPVVRRHPFSPDSLTIAALVLNLAAAVALAGGGARPVFFLVAFPLIAVAGILDLLDGMTARARGTASRWGDFLDHFFDRVSDLSLAAGWAIGAAVRLEMALALVVAVALNGYIGTQVEATWGRRDHETVGRAEFVVALLLLPVISYWLATRSAATAARGALTIEEWIAAVVIIFALLGVIQRMRQAKRLGRGE